MLKTALYFVVISSVCYFANSFESDDIEEPDSLFAHQRFERSDYSIGGPLAKQGMDTSRGAYNQLKTSNSRQYTSKSDDDQHYQVYKNSGKRVLQLNTQRQDEDDALFGETKYADRSFSDFSKRYLGAIKEPKPAERFQYDVSQVVTGIPQKHDWRNDGVVPPVRNQKECGSCYAFSTSDLVATQWAIDHNETKPEPLAPQYVLDCVPRPSAFGCQGGRPFLVLQNSENCTGNNCSWAKESCYPYKKKDGSTNACKESTSKCTRAEKMAKKIERAYYLDVSTKGSKVEKERLAALLHQGPVVALVTVTDHWQHYKRGVMRTSQCSGADEPNHAVLIVGYDYTHPKSPHYIVRNSWGTDWGENGYFRLEAGNNACGIGQYLSFACTHDCGEDKNSTNLLHRARKKLERRGIKQQPNAWEKFKGQKTSNATNSSSIHHNHNGTNDHHNGSYNRHNGSSTYRSSHNGSYTHHNGSDYHRNRYTTVSTRVTNSDMRNRRQRFTPGHVTGVTPRHVTGAPKAPRKRYPDPNKIRQLNKLRNAAASNGNIRTPQG